MSYTRFYFITGGDLQGAIGLLMSEGVSYRYSARAKEVRFLLKNEYRAMNVCKKVKLFGCKVRMRYE